MVPERLKYSIIVFLMYITLSEGMESLEETTTTRSEETLHCYQCNSQTDPDCKELLHNSSIMYYKPCPLRWPSSNESFCRKIVQRIYPRNDLEVVVRSCGWVKHDSADCYAVRSHTHREMVCQCFSNACNASPHTLQSAGLLLVVCTALSLITSHPVTDI